MLDPGAKSLVFSTWTDVLDILASALVENDIPFAALQDQGKFKRNLEKFKVTNFEYRVHTSLVLAILLQWFLVESKFAPFCFEII